MTSALAPNPDKPLLRGVLHKWAAPVAAGGGIVLVAMATTLRAACASGVFGMSLVALLTISATYHRINWKPAARAWMRRADHAAIFILIAGTYTPLALLALPAHLGTRLSLIVWIGALIGVLQSLFWVHAPKVITAALCVAVGWSLAPYLGELRASLAPSVLWLILGGGLAYTLGACAYAFKRPNLKPGVFGYHEVFHALTLIGAGLHFVAIIQMVRNAK